MRVQYSYAFPRPSVTATIFLLVQSTWNSNVAHIILGRRGRKDGAYSGFLCVPGGFLDAKVDTGDVECEFNRHHYSSIAEANDNGWDVEEVFEDAGIKFDPDKIEEAFNKPGETIEDTAIREVFEETGLRITKDQLELAYVSSDPNTDPRAHVVNICYYVVIDHKLAATAVAGDDLEELLIESVDKVGEHALAFNHNELFDKVIEVANKNYPESDDEV